MKLMTKEIENKFKKYPIGSQENVEDPTVVVKYFNPCGAGTWLVTEGEKQENGDWLMFGYCNICEWEWGSLMLSDLENLRLPFGLGIERDLHIDNNVTVNQLLN